MRFNVATLLRFAAYVPKAAPDECWEWKGPLNPKGYARFVWHDQGVRRQLPAYRVAWELASGQRWPDDKIACHSCDNPRCVNPDHVRPGTFKDNYADALERGRLGNDAANVNRRRRHCKNGHELAGENLIVLKNGWRRCRECNRTRAREWHRKKVAKQ